MIKTMSIIKTMSTSRPRMLLIDDDANVREVLEHLLTSFGYECQTATDATSGLARFAEGGWDLLLVDIVMPGMSGWALVEAIKRRTPTVPVILITGLNQPAVMQRARTLRLPVIAKPFRADALRAVVVKALQEAPSHSSPTQPRRPAESLRFIEQAPSPARRGPWRGA